MQITIHNWAKKYKVPARIVYRWVREKKFPEGSVQKIELNQTRMVIDEEIQPPVKYTPRCSNLNHI